MPAAVIFRRLGAVAALAMALGFCISPRAAERSSHLGIGQALRYALEHAPTITSAKANITGSEAQKLAAIAAFLPSLTLTEQLQTFHPYSGAGSTFIGGLVVPAQHPFDVSVASPNLNFNLYNGGKDTANYHSAIEALRSANLGFTATMDSPCVRIVVARIGFWKLGAL